MASRFPLRDLAPTEELLLVCAHPDASPQWRARIARLCEKEIHWPRLLDLGIRHGVSALLYRALGAESGVPDDAREQLLLTYTRRAARNLLLARELTRILAAFEAGGIPVFVHKGLAIASQAYRDITLRHVGDLDLVIGKENLGRARTILVSSGYRCKAARSDDGAYHEVLCRSSPEIVVELHWAFTRAEWPLRVPWDVLWSRCIFTQVANVPVPCLDPALGILALCAHGGKEGWSRLALVADLAALIHQHPGLDWGWILQQARRMERERMLLLGLSLAEVLLAGAGSAAPEGALGALPPSVFERIEANAAVRHLSRLVWRSLLSAQPLRGFDYHRTMWLLAENPAGQARYAAHAVTQLPRRVANLLHPTENDLQSVSLPSRLSFFYYVVRPLRLLHTYRHPFALVKTAIRRL
ncbi:MAG: nucleotidyltransferase family protein [Bryobacteraceae bacterium]